MCNADPRSTQSLLVATMVGAPCRWQRVLPRASMMWNNWTLSFERMQGRATWCNSCKHLEGSPSDGYRPKLYRSVARLSSFQTPNYVRFFRSPQQKTPITMFKSLFCTLVALTVAVVSANEFHSPHVTDLKADFAEKVSARADRSAHAWCDGEF